MAVAPSFVAARRHFPAHLRPHGSPEESSVMEAGAALVEALVDAGVDTAFTVPGESFLPVLEALRHRRNRILLVSVRHAAGGTFAAHGYAALPCRPAAVFGSRWPGAATPSPRP